MKISKIRDLTIEEIQQKLNESSQKLFQLKYENISGQLKNPLQIRGLRRDVARMKTVINEKKTSKEQE